MNNPVTEAWEAYQGATAKYLDMQKAEAPRPQLFEQAMLVNKLQKEFAATYDRLSCAGHGLRLVGGLDVNADR